MTSGIKNVNILDYSVPEYLKTKIETGIEFVDTMLDGGFVPSSTALLSGEPGAGKTTLMAQIANALTSKGNIVLYNSVEQTADQVANLASNLNLEHGFFFERYSDPKNIMSHVKLLQENNPKKNVFLIVDSVSVLANNSRAEATRMVKSFTDFCQATKCIGLFIVHLTKGGEFAGSNSMLHDVDAYYHMKIANMEEDSGIRTLTVRKNRFGRQRIVSTVLTKEGHVDPSKVFNMDEPNAQNEPSSAE